MSRGSDDIMGPSYTSKWYCFQCGDFLLDFARGLIDKYEVLYEWGACSSSSVLWLVFSMEFDNLWFWPCPSFFTNTKFTKISQNSWKPIVMYDPVVWSSLKCREVSIPLAVSVGLQTGWYIFFKTKKTLHWLWNTYNEQYI